MTAKNTSRWEIAFVLLTGLGNFILADRLDLQLVYVVAASLFWTGFVLVRASSDPSAPADWGFTRRGFGRAIGLLTPFMVLSVLGFAAYGKLTGSMALNWHIVPVLLLYPLWGLVQQFLVVVLIAGNIRKHSRLPESVTVILAALLFAAAHASSPALTGAAFVLALITATVYFRTGNLWAPGLFHGLFGTCLYYFVLGRDPLMEIIHGHG
ncbi:MAG: hypothetical protein AVO35_11135 [Candidatus Aegiribacteria sp. MLS_C]|nr:MAG: hypothetical protein AVO35_11135 [Candidatus Aegiribacteria sp. MLS_C]